MEKIESKDIRKMYRTALKEEFPSTLKLVFGDREITYKKRQWSIKEGSEEKTYGLRYGYNPHQRGAIYGPEGYQDLFFNDLEFIKMGKGGPSATNVEDLYRGMTVCSHFDMPAVAVMKHLNPCGVALGLNSKSFSKTLEDAWNCDNQAAFGGCLCSNVPFTEDAVDIIKNIYEGKYDKSGHKQFVECIIAPDFEKGAIDYFEEKKDIRIARISGVEKMRKYLKEKTDEIIPLDYELKSVGGLIMLQERYRTKITSLDELKKLPVVTQRKPTEKELQTMLYGWWIVGQLRSNATLLMREDRTIGIGMGQVDRIGTIEHSIRKAKEMGHETRGCIEASDGFMLGDNLKPLHEVGVSAVIQPGGSMLDNELIEQADKFGMTMIPTAERCFQHF